MKKMLYNVGIQAFLSAYLKYLPKHIFTALTVYVALLNIALKRKT